MRVVIDVEANGLVSPTEIWCIVCKDIDTGKINIFRNPTSDEFAKEDFLKYSRAIVSWIGHNLLGYDRPVLSRLLGVSIPLEHCIDTLVLSKLVNYSRPNKHSIEAYGEEFGYPKGINSNLDFFKKWTQELEDYCVRDVEICGRIFLLYHGMVTDGTWHSAIDTEQRFEAKAISVLHDNGFNLNTGKASSLLARVEGELAALDEKILEAFKPKEVLVKEFTPRATKYGTISKTSVPRTLWDNIPEYEVGKTYRQTKFVSFNPASPKQIIDVLDEAGWQPEHKTDTHKDTELALRRLKYTSGDTKELDIKEASVKLLVMQKYGWKVNEHNLSTLPSTAPVAARLLAKRILLESRRRTLTEWIGLCSDKSRIHGKFYGIGAWSHRMAHQKPNTANIPNEFKEDGTKKLLGKELRQLWQAPKNRLLVGVDAEGIQLRIFAHYVNDPELTKSLTDGRKDNKTDPHSLNQRVLGEICKSRAAAKRFLYALLLGGGIGKFSQILECSREQAEEAVDTFNQRYPGFSKLKQERFPSDAQRGYFEGLDGRRVPIPGTTISDRRHLAMSGYLQNGEAIVMKRATLKWIDKLPEMDALLVNLVHDEWQTECPNNMAVALEIAKMQADSLRVVGEELKLNCPLAGSYWNEDHKDYTIGTNWYQTH